MAEFLDRLKIPIVSADPTGSQGELLYNSTSNVVKAHDGSTWNNVGSSTATATTPIEAWHSIGGGGEPAFQNSWVNFGGTDPVAQFRKDPLGKVELRGMIKTGTVNTTIFTLPAGYRPAALLRFPIMSNAALGYATIDSSGNVVLVSGSNTSASLENIEFDTDTVTSFSAVQLYEGARQVGVVNGTDCALTVNSVTQVTIAAGTVYVTSASGLLLRTTTISTVLSSIPAASASNFRLDQVVVDSVGTVTRLAGTQSTTVTLANRTGAATIPAGSQLLHDMLVNSTGVVSSNNRDRRPWARGAFNRIIRTANAAAGSDYSTTSGSVVDIDATNLAMRIECTGVPLRFSLRGRMYHSSANGFGSVGPIVDTTVPDGAAGSIYSGHNSIANGQIPLNASWTFTPTAGSHLIKAQWVTGSPTFVIYANTNIPLIMEIEEITRQNANNGIT